MKKALILLTVCVSLGIFSNINVYSQNANPTGAEISVVEATNDTTNQAVEPQSTVESMSILSPALILAAVAILLALVAIVLCVLNMVGIKTEQSKRRTHDSQLSSALDELQASSQNATQIRNIAKEVSECAIQEYHIRNEQAALLAKSLEQQQLPAEPAPIVEEVPAVQQEKILYGAYSPQYQGFPNLDISETRNSESTFCIRVLSNDSAKYQLLESVSPSLLQSALDGLEYTGDTQRYSSIKPVCDGILSYNDDAKYWSVVKKASVSFEA